MLEIIKSTKPEPNSLPGFWEPNDELVPLLPKSVTVKEFENIDKDNAIVLENVLSEEECKSLISFMNCSPNFEEVGVQGMKDKKDDRIGSLRTSVWSPKIAEGIWNRIENFLSIKWCGKFTATDWYQKNEIYYIDGDCEAEPIAVSPLLRFMKYSNGCSHNAHYDASFIYPNNPNYRTLKSMVIYLTTNENAATRFIDDKQQNKPIWNRNHDDWNRGVRCDEIIAKSECIAGNVLLFDHRMCHDVEQYFGNKERIIIRGDIIYEF
jgi:hypothetical protein